MAFCRFTETNNQSQTKDMETSKPTEAGAESERDKWQRINAERRAVEKAEMAGHWDTRVLDWVAERTNKWADRIAERKALWLLITGFAVGGCVFSHRVRRWLFVGVGLLFVMVMFFGLLVGVADGVRRAGKKWGARARAANQAEREETV